MGEEWEKNTKSKLANYKEIIDNLCCQSGNLSLPLHREDVKSFESKWFNKDLGTSRDKSHSKQSKFCITRFTFEHQKNSPVLSFRKLKTLL